MTPAIASQRSRFHPVAIHGILVAVASLLTLGTLPIAAAPDSVTTATTASSRRIITLAPNLTEIVFTLGFGNEVVGITDYCHYPPQVENRTRVGGLYNPNLEQMLALKPTLVFYVPHHSDLARKLDDLGISTVKIPSETIADVLEGIRRISRTLDSPSRGDALVEELRQNIATLRARVASLPPKRVLLVVDHEPGSIRGLYAVGSGNYLDELVRIAGGINILSDTPVTYPKISPEILLRDPPDVILDTKFADGASVDRAAMDEMKKAWNELFKNTPNPPRIEFVTQPRVNIPGPSIAFALRTLAAQIHGPAFKATREPAVPTAKNPPLSVKNPDTGKPSPPSTQP